MAKRKIITDSFYTPNGVVYNKRFCITSKIHIKPVVLTEEQQKYIIFWQKELNTYEVYFLDVAIPTSYATLYLQKYKSNMTEGEIIRIAKTYYYKTNITYTQFETFIKKYSKDLLNYTSYLDRMKKLGDILQCFNILDFNHIIKNSFIHSHPKHMVYLSPSSKSHFNGFTEIVRAVIAVYSLQNYIPKKFQAKKSIFQILEKEAFSENRIDNKQKSFELIKENLNTSKILFKILSNTSSVIFKFLNKKDKTSFVAAYLDIPEIIEELSVGDKLLLSYCQIMLLNTVKATMITSVPNYNFFARRSGLHPEYKTLGIASTGSEIARLLFRPHNEEICLKTYLNKLGIYCDIIDIYNNDEEFYKNWNKSIFEGSLNEFAVHLSIRYKLKKKNRLCEYDQIKDSILGIILNEKQNKTWDYIYKILVQTCDL
jgi:hypothetical protein